MTMQIAIVFHTTLPCLTMRAHSCTIRNTQNESLRQTQAWPKYQQCDDFHHAIDLPMFCGYADVAVAPVAAVEIVTP